MNTQKDLYFHNRQDAGEQLGLFLESKYKHLNPLIIGIPRGGVEVAFYVANRLNAELSLVVSKKLPLPGHSEYGFGAIAEDASIYVSSKGKKIVSPEIIDQIIERQALEINRRKKEYRHGKGLPEMKDKTVVLVDDGIATGVTLVPVIRLCRKKGADKIVVAAPVSGTSYDENLKEADHIEILVQPENFHAVGQVYKDFSEVTDEQVKDILLKAKSAND